MKCRTARKVTDMEFGWSQNSCSLNIRAFSELILSIYQRQFLFKPLPVFFDNETRTILQNDTNRYADQQINKRKHEGPLKTNTVHAQWRKVDLYKINTKPINDKGYTV
jgi:hypothetical protein